MGGCDCKVQIRQRPSERSEDRARESVLPHRGKSRSSGLCGKHMCVCAEPSHMLCDVHMCISEEGAIVSILSRRDSLQSRDTNRFHH